MISQEAQRRMPKYLSPSALALFESNPQDYYLRYVTPFKPPSMLQTQPMSVGSAFDAYVKSYLHEKIYGKNHPESAKYELEALLKAQVEPHNLDWARAAGQYVFEKYLKSGAMADLMLELNKAVDEPRFEFEVKGVIEGYREGINAKKMGVPLLGKPDIRFINSEGAHAIFDWKVNGFCGRSNTSPQAGYIECLEENCGYWMRKGPHKDAFITDFKGLRINTGSYFEMYDSSWATQLATYGWLMGEPVGVEGIIGVDQIVCNGAKPDPSGYPTIRIAKHRTRISERFQFEVMHRYQTLWSILTDEPFYFFRDKSFEDSAKLCESLDLQAQMMGGQLGELTSDEQWICDIARG